MPAPQSLEDLTVDQLLATAKETQAAHRLLQSLMSDPASREMVQRHVKKIEPSRPIPEIDTRDAIEAKIEEERKARQALEAQIRERDIRERLEKERSRVSSHYRLSENDMLEVEKLMTDKDNPIPSYDAAARVFKASASTGTPTTAHLAPPTFDMPESDVWGKGIGNKANLDKIAMNEAFKALNDLRSGRVSGLGPATTS